MQRETDKLKSIRKQTNSGHTIQYRFTKHQHIQHFMNMHFFKHCQNLKNMS